MKWNVLMGLAYNKRAMVDLYILIASPVKGEFGVTDMFTILLGLVEYIAPVTAVITAATAVTAVTPTKTDDKYINIILKVLNFFAGNFLKNKNKDA